MNTQSNTTPETGATATPALELYFHPFSRAATVLWMLEELEGDATIHFVDISEGAQKRPEFLALNPMGKVPTLVDGDVVITEVAAIGMYLADRSSLGRLAPGFDDPRRASYLRWILFGPSVIEPCAYARSVKWEYPSGSVGWGTWGEMHEGIEAAIGGGPWVLGDHFTMADVCLGATLRTLMRFGMLENRKPMTDYVARLEARPALQRADARNARLIAQHGLG